MYRLKNNFLKLNFWFLQQRCKTGNLLFFVKFKSTKPLCSYSHSLKFPFLLPYEPASWQAFRHSNSPSLPRSVKGEQSQRPKFDSWESEFQSLSLYKGSDNHRNCILLGLGILRLNLLNVKPNVKWPWKFKNGIHSILDPN